MQPAALNAEIVRRGIWHSRLQAVSLYSVVRRAKRETQMATCMTDGARWERHKERETTPKARENGLSRSSDFLA